MTLSKLAQIALSTRDLPKAIAFYRDVLGFALQFEVSGMAFFDAGGTRLMIGPAHHQGALRNQHVRLFRRRRRYATSSANRAQPQIRTRSRNRQRAEGRNALRFFKDPDGNALAIMGGAEVASKLRLQQHQFFRRRRMQRDGRVEVALRCLHLHCAIATH